MPALASSSPSVASSRRTLPTAGGRPSDELRRGLCSLRSELLGRAMRLTRSAAVAEDLVQDTVERALKFESHYIEGTNVRAWVHQILFSVFITRCRRSRRERKALGWLGSDPCAWTCGEDAAPAMQEVSPGVRRALEGLPPSFRSVVELVDLQEMAYRDAAEVLGVPVGTVMSRLHRGRKLLAAELRPAAIEAIAPVAADDDLQRAA
jgi:RNA polymerase sigma-70 factor (ECF subfamily)